MWKSSAHLPPGRGKLAYTGDRFYTHPAVHGDEVKSFIASEFSQWLGERYGVEEDGVYTGSSWGDGKRMLEYKTKSLSLADAKNRLAGYEHDLTQHRGKGVSSSSGGKKSDQKKEKDLMEKIREIEKYIETLNIDMQHKAKKSNMVYQKPVKNNAAKPQSTGNTSSHGHMLHSVGNNTVRVDHTHHTHPLIGGGNGEDEDDEEPEADPHGYTSFHSNASQGPASLRRQHHTTNYKTI
jgi:hypothetical protein